MARGAEPAGERRPGENAAGRTRGASRHGPLGGLEAAPWAPVKPWKIHETPGFIDDFPGFP